MIKFERRFVRAMGWISLAWLFAGTGLCWYKGVDGGASSAAILWFFGFWILALTDLGALYMLLGSAALLMNEGTGSEKKAAHAIRTLSWGILKLACLGLFGLLLFNGNAIPSVSLLTGLGTLVVVPLAGGLIWSQGILKNA